MKRVFSLIAILALNALPVLAQVTGGEDAAVAEVPMAPRDTQRVEALSRQVTELQQQLEALKSGDAAASPKLADLEKQIQKVSEELKAVQAAPPAPAAPVPPTAPVPGAVTVTGPDGASAVIDEGGIRTSNGDLARIGGSYTVAKDEVIRGNANITGGSMTIDGKVLGNASVLGGSMRINGTVNGNVKVLGGSLTLGDGSHVRGNVEVVGGAVHRSEGARVDGGISETGGRIGMPSVAVPGVVDLGDFAHGKNPWGSLPGLVALFFLGAILLAAVPQRIDTIGRMFVAKPAHSFVVGIFGSLAALMATILTCGLGSLLTVPVMTVATLMGIVAVTVILGRRVLIGKTYRSRLMPLLTGLGMWFLALLATTVVEPLTPFLWIVTWLAIIAATGAALTTGFGKNAVWLRSRVGAAGNPYDPASSYAEF